MSMPMCGVKVPMCDVKVPMCDGGCVMMVVPVCNDGDGAL